MQQPTETRAPGDRSTLQGWETAPSPTSSSFARMLTALATPAQAPESPENGAPSTRWRPTPSWNEDDLADDVATLSYESALKAHARYRPSQVSDQSLLQPANADPFSADAELFSYEEASAVASQPAAPSIASPGAIAGSQPAATPEQLPGFLRTAPYVRNLKDSSITIRMSKAECAQLHRRAAEAGMTVSAYLRSCTFEAESLRKMVKDTLAQLRSVTAHAKPAPPAPALRARFRKLAVWLARLFTPWNSSQRIARA